MISDAEVEAFRRDGAVCVRGAFHNWVETIAAGIEQNMREPGPYASENLKPGDTGRFFDDYCNWERIPAFRKVVRESPAAEIAARAMRSRRAQFFHDHVLVKEPGTYRPVPDPDAEPDRYDILEWTMEPGDAVLFDYRAVHGARANMLPRRRRALSIRWVGDDARYVTRPGRTSPPYPGHGMVDGQRLREDWFPVVLG